jgi:hypothetical protein
MKNFYLLLLYVALLFSILGFTAPVLISATSNTLVILGVALVLGTVPWLVIGIIKQAIKVLERFNDYTNKN